MAGLTWSNAEAISVHERRYGVALQPTPHHWIINSEPTPCSNRTHRHGRSYQALCLNHGEERCFSIYHWVPRKAKWVDLAISDQRAKQAAIRDMLAAEHSLLNVRGV